MTLRSIAGQLATDDAPAYLSSMFPWPAEVRLRMTFVSDLNVVLMLQ